MFFFPKAKRKKAYTAVQKTVKFSNETAHFTKDTTASRLKKVERQKTAAKGETKFPKKVDNGADGGAGLNSSVRANGNKEQVWDRPPIT